jgi:aspartyl-tRNA(Asn)/glutamyl-tRNA(Gln) amidotransferase subunit A
MALRQKIRQEYAEILANCDVILTPTTPSVAYGVNDNVTDPVKMYQADICTVTVNIASLPAISTPCGYNKDGMPIGMSIIGRHFDEATIIQTADAFERQFNRILPQSFK